MSLLLLLLLLLIGMPIGFVLLFVGSLGIFLVDGMDSLRGVLASSAFRSVNSFTLTTIPLFVLMANFIQNSKIADDLYDCLLKWIGHLPGGVGSSTVVTSAGFGAVSGSSTAATMIMSNISIPQMIKSNYTPSFSAGLVATATGTIAALIPPSIPLVLYGIQTQTSIGSLLIAGIIPGLILTLLLCIYVVVASYKNKSKVDKFTWIERWKSLYYIWPITVLAIIVIGFMYLGIGTSTEAAAIGAVGALIIGLLYRRLNVRSVISSLRATVMQSSMIFMIMVGAQIFTYFITMTGINRTLVDGIMNSGLSKWYILALIIILYLLIGTVMDPIGAMLLTLPLVHPIIVSLGFDVVWFGIILVMLLEIGLVTPPVGLNLFITSQASGVPVQKVFVGSIPFIMILLLMVILLIIFPQIPLYLLM